jgi:hypothetical protein
MKSRTGIRNLEYGVWKSRCCGDEIVLYRGAVFPMCNRHNATLTEWVLVSTSILDKPKKAPADLHISLARLKELSGEGVLSDQTECAHLKTCEVCRSQLKALARDYHQRSLDETDKSKSA